VFAVLPVRTCNIHILDIGDTTDKTEEANSDARVVNAAIAALPDQRPMSRERLHAAIARNLTPLRPGPGLDVSANGPELEELDLR